MVPEQAGYIKDELQPITLWAIRTADVIADSNPQDCCPNDAPLGHAPQRVRALMSDSIEAADDQAVRALLEVGDVDRAVTVLLSQLGPQVFGFLRGTLRGEDDADEVFAATSVKIWRGLSTFQWQCSLRTWVYIIARRELTRFLQGTRRRNVGRITSSALDDVVARVRTETLSAVGTEKRDRLAALRDELPLDDRTLLILRVDRDLKWEDVARTFLGDGENADSAQIKRESGRLRKRFQLVTQRLSQRAREEGLLPRR